MSEIIDIRWPICLPCHIPIQHEYQLLGALSHFIPRLHHDAGVAIHSIRGIASEPGMLELKRSSALTIRCEPNLIPSLLSLSGKSLSLGRFSIRLGVPQLFALRGVHKLASNFVTIKGFMEPDAFLGAARRQLSSLSVSDSAHVDVGDRKVRHIKGNVIIGFQVTVSGLNDQESLAIQAAGIGGRRRLGAGIFTPAISHASKNHNRRHYEKSFIEQS